MELLLSTKAVVGFFPLSSLTQALKGKNVLTSYKAGFMCLKTDPVLTYESV